MFSDEQGTRNKEQGVALFSNMKFLSLALIWFVICSYFVFGSCITPKPPKMRAISSTKQRFQAFIAASGPFFSPLLVVKAKEGINIREEIAKGAASIPGYGQPDIFYPNTFEGRWRTTLTVNDVIINDVNSCSKLKEGLLYVKSFEAKRNIDFIRSFVKRGDASGSSVVEDRAFSMKSLMEALTARDAQASWEASNPNLLTFSSVIADEAIITEQRVTKRSIEALDEGQVGYSEYSRLAEVSGNLLSAVPTIFGKRVLVRMKTNNPSAIVGVLRTYYYGGDYFEIDANPIMIVKSRFVMTPAL